ncbi:MAG: hypothetical protein J0I09_10440 [Sphingobacteriia bacterium]|nr:hypothetical protein [Sphingobacteriia bacterium]
MDYIYSKYPLQTQENSSTIGRLGVLVGIALNDAPDIFVRIDNSRELFIDCYNRVHAINDIEVARIFCTNELIEILKRNPDSNRGYDMKIIATFPDAEILLKKDISESIGAFLTLYEGHPEKTKVQFIDYKKWASVVLMMETTSPN